MDYGAEAIIRHRASRGKIGIAPKMKVETAEDLSIAYTPGVAAVSLAIAADKAESYALTNRGNTVAIVTDGTAVLGLGNVGPEAAMAVMEGKSILFKGLADIDAFPICLATQDNQSIIQTVKNLVPTFGGINLEDIAAPRCFEIEAALQDLGIPVFHDDQHGTAIVMLAAVINSLQVVGKRLGDVKVVFSGAGAGGIASAKLLYKYGAKNIVLVFSHKIILPKPVFYSQGPQLPTTMSRSDTSTMPSWFISAAQPSHTPQLSITAKISLTPIIPSPLTSSSHSTASPPGIRVVTCLIGAPSPGKNSSIPTSPVCGESGESKAILTMVPHRNAFAFTSTLQGSVAAERTPSTNSNDHGAFE